MQADKQYISPIKQRILYFIDEIGITKREFYRRTDISRGTLENLSSSVSEIVLEKFIATFDNVNIIWLITGEGEMVKSHEVVVNEGSGCKLCDKKDRLIEKLERQLERQEKEIDRLTPNQ